MRGACASSRNACAGTIGHAYGIFESTFDDRDFRHRFTYSGKVGYEIDFEEVRRHNRK